MMYTVYLVRDINTPPPIYLSFIANEADLIKAETAFSSDRYSEALLHASILFELYHKNIDQIASYIESPYDSLAVVSYSEGEFKVRKTADHFLYANLIDKYESLLTRVTTTQAFKIIKRENNLTLEQRLKLAHFLKIRVLQ